MSGGFEPWHTSTGGGGSGVTSFATVGSTPTAAGASVSGATATLQPADATHAGVVAASGSQTLGTGSRTVLQGNFTIDGNNAVVPDFFITNSSGGNGRLRFDGLTSAQMLLKNSASAGLEISNASSGDVYLTVDLTAVKAIRLPRNVGFTFPTTLAPSGTTQTIDWATGSSQTIDAASTTGTLVLTFSNPVSGGRYILKTLGKTGRAWTMPTSLWAGGVKPTVTAVDGAIDVFQFIYDGTNYIGSIIAQNVS